MKSLLVVRHAKSNWDNAELDDFERPLSKRGKSEAPVVAQQLRDAGLHPDLIISSSALRAVTPARTFASILDYPLALMYITNSLYEASIAEVLAVIGDTPNDISTVMVVGHNPTSTLLVNALCKNGIDEMVTACAVHITFDDNVRWGEAMRAAGTMKKVYTAK